MDELGVERDDREKAGEGGAGGKPTLLGKLSKLFFALVVLKTGMTLQDACFFLHLDDD